MILPCKKFVRAEVGGRDPAVRMPQAVGECYGLSARPGGGAGGDSERSSDLG